MSGVGSSLDIAQEDPRIEQLAREFHNVYQLEARLQGDDSPAEDYDSLSDKVKEFDRVLARHVFEKLERPATRLATLVNKLTAEWRHQGTVAGVIDPELDEEMAAIYDAQVDVERAVGRLEPARSSPAIGAVDVGPPERQTRFWVFMSGYWSGFAVAAFIGGVVWLLTK